MNESLFLDFSTAIKRLNFVPYLEHLDKYFSSWLTDVLSLVTEFDRISDYCWMRSSYTSDNEAEVSVVLSFCSPQNLSVYTCSFPSYVQQRMLLAWSPMWTDLKFKKVYIITMTLNNLLLGFFYFLLTFGMFFCFGFRGFNFFYFLHCWAFLNCRHPYKEFLLSDILWR